MVRNMFSSYAVFRKIVNFKFAHLCNTSTYFLVSSLKYISNTSRGKKGNKKRHENARNKCRSVAAISRGVRVRSPLTGEPMQSTWVPNLQETFVLKAVVSSDYHFQKMNDVVFGRCFRKCAANYSEISTMCLRVFVHL